MKRFLFLAITLLLIGCQSNDSATNSTTETTEIISADTEGDNISDSNLGNIYSLINNMDITNSNVNAIPLYVNLDKDSAAIFKYNNKAEYAVSVTIKGVTDTDVYKKIEVRPNSQEDIRFTPSIELNEGEISCYTIDIYCSEVNLSGSISLEKATLK